MGFFDRFRRSSVPPAPTAEAPIDAWFTLLLAKPLEDAAALVAAVVAPLGGRVAGQVVSLDGTDIPFAFGHGEVPRGTLDVRFWPASAPRGSAWIALRAAPLARTHERRVAAVTARLRLAVSLLQGHGVGVVVHRAGDVLLPSSTWFSRMGSVDTWSVAALTDLGSHETAVFTLGLEPLGLADVRVPLLQLHSTLDVEEAYERAQSACMLASYELRTHGMLGTMAVPIGYELGTDQSASPNPEAELAPTDTFGVQPNGGFSELVPLLPLVSVGQLWAEGAETTAAYLPYRMLFSRLLKENGWREVSRVSNARVPGLRHQIFEVLHDDGSRAIVTCGFGRRRQVRGTFVHHDAHLELLIPLEPGSLEPFGVASYLGHVLHERGADASPWSPGHRVQYAYIEKDAYPFVVFGWGGSLRPAEGPAISLYRLLPMTAAERARVPADRGQEWADAEGSALAPARWREIAAQ